MYLGWTDIPEQRILYSFAVLALGFTMDASLVIVFLRNRYLCRMFSLGMILHVCSVTMLFEAY